MRSLWLGFALCLALAAPADAALRCRNWDELDDGQKSEELEAEIERVLNSNTAQQYQVNRVTIRKCLQRKIPDMQDQFDGICAEGKSAPMNALEKEFERYLYTCVG
jgi:hypothetical protein